MLQVARALVSLTANYQLALRVATQVAQEAGGLLLKEFHRSGGPREAQGGSPVDAEVEAIIRQQLQAVFPTHGIRGEELGPWDRESQDAAGHVWLIDPNDGTSPYLRGYRGSAVSIALLRSGLPVLGVVFAFAAPNDQGDLICWAEGCGAVTRNGRPVERSWASELAANHILLVRPAADRNAQGHAELAAPARFRSIPGIAYKLALVAVGEGDVAVSLNAPRDWDFAAGHALLRGVGGDLFDAFGQPITYSSAGVRPRGGQCFGGGRDLVRVVCQRNWALLKWQAPQVMASYPLVEPQKHLILNHPDPGILARAQGCLLGQLSGSALGRQGLSIEGISSLRSKLEIMTAGQPPNDAELALILARALIQHQHFDQHAILKAYLYWLDSGPVNVRTSLRSALTAARTALDIGADPVVAVQNQVTHPARGSLMWISPLAIWGWAGSATSLAHWARLEAQLSYPHAICQDANAVWVIAIQAALTQGGSPQDLYNYTLDWAETHFIDPLVLKSLQEARFTQPDCFQSGGVGITLQNAFYQLLHAATFQQGVIDTVVQGGDTTANAAATGALLGAMYGYAEIPMQWRNQMLTCRTLADQSHPRPAAFWPVDSLVLAERLLVVGAQLTST